MAAARTKTKQLVQDAHTIVEDMLEGLVQAQPHLALVANEKIVLHRDFEHIKQRQVTLLSGGGSGHEPAHAGYIGEGMLTGVICGNVFASPTTHQVLTAIRHVAGPKGCLVIVKNYTGDRLNFGLAVEQAKAEGFLVGMVVVGEDVAVVNANAGRRGLSGTVLIHKLAGAAAKSGADLKTIVEMVDKVSTKETLGTIGVALRPCTLPGQDGPSRELGENEMELGLGIHGEPGIERCELQDAPAVTERMIERLAGTLALGTGASSVLMVNNLGASTTMELCVVAKHAIAALTRRGVDVKRVLVGSFMTALDMAGFSLTTWKLDGDAALLKHFDAPTTATAWNYSPFEATSQQPQLVQPLHAANGHPVYTRPETLSPAAQRIDKAIRAACEALIKSEPELTAWDAKVGDGDCGTTFRNAAKAILADLAAKYPLEDPAATLRALAHSVSQSAGGTSGVLYTIMFTTAAVQMEALHAEKTRTIPTAQAFGRTGYVDQAQAADIPDPGAKAAAIWIRAVVDALVQS